MTASRPSHELDVAVVGAGVVGLACAVALLARGARVTVHERGAHVGAEACSWYAGGMLALWCEGESAEEPVVRLGREAAAWWERHAGGVVRRGTLVVASSRDRAELRRFGERTSRFEDVDGAAIAGLEPDLAGRFSRGLFFAEEAHLDPRLAIAALAERVLARGGTIRFGSEVEPAALDAEVVLDCRGLAARDVLPELRGVKGEIAMVETQEVKLERPVRLLHPRWPLYVIPRAANHFMIGATSIESEDTGVSVRSALELLTAAYAVHPAFGEARIVEIGAGLRPAFPDNLPRIVLKGRTITVNGLYRHGFLLAPALAELTLAYVERGAIDNEVMQCS